MSEWSAEEEAEMERIAMREDERREESKRQAYEDDRFEAEVRADERAKTLAEARERVEGLRIPPEVQDAKQPGSVPLIVDRERERIFNWAIDDCLTALEGSSDE